MKRIAIVLLSTASAAALAQYSNGPVPSAVQQMPVRWMGVTPGCGYTGHVDCFYAPKDDSMGATSSTANAVLLPAGYPAPPTDGTGTPPPIVIPPVTTPDQPAPPASIEPPVGTITNGWYKITDDNWQAVVIAPGATKYRFGGGSESCTACWNLHTATPGAVVYPHHSLNDGSDPVPNVPDGTVTELDIQQTNAVQIVTVTDNSKTPAVVTTLTVPALGPVTPPATPLTTFTCTFTLSADLKSVTPSCK